MSVNLNLEFGLMDNLCEKDQCSVQPSIEYGLVARVWFILYCEWCGRVYHSPANGRLKVYNNEREWKEK